MIDSKQFAWLYMVEHGYAGCKPDYYGGYAYADNVAKKIAKGTLESSRLKKVQDFYMEHVRRVGVNWKKTSAPHSGSYSSFTDTFHDPETTEAIFGTLYLKDGTKQTWYSDSISVTNVFDMMAEAADAQVRFYTTFGEPR